MRIARTVLMGLCIIWLSGCHEDDRELVLLRAMNADVQGEIEWAREYYREYVALTGDVASRQRLLRLVRTGPNQDAHEAIRLGEDLHREGQLPPALAVTVADSYLVTGQLDTALAWSAEFASPSMAAVAAAAHLQQGGPDARQSIERLHAAYPEHEDIRVALVRAAWAERDVDGVIALGDELVADGVVRSSLLAVLIQAHMLAGQRAVAENYAALRRDLLALTRASSADRAPSEMLAILDAVEERLGQPLQGDLLLARRQWLARAGRQAAAPRLPAGAGKPDQPWDEERAALDTLLSAPAAERSSLAEKMLARWSQLSPVQYYAASVSNPPEVRRLRRALELAPWNTEYRRALAVNLRRGGDLDEALLVLERAPQPNPQLERLSRQWRGQ